MRMTTWPPQRQGVRERTGMVASGLKEQGAGSVSPLSPERYCPRVCLLASLAGFLVLLHLPFVGHWVSHGLLHLIGYA